MSDLVQILYGLAGSTTVFGPGVDVEAAYSAALNNAAEIPVLEGVIIGVRAHKTFIGGGTPGGDPDVIAWNIGGPEEVISAAFPIGVSATAKTSLLTTKPGGGAWTLVAVNALVVEARTFFNLGIGESGRIVVDQIFAELWTAVGGMLVEMPVLFGVEEPTGGQVTELVEDRVLCGMVETNERVEVEVGS